MRYFSRALSHMAVWSSVFGCVYVASDHTYIMWVPISGAVASLWIALGGEND